MEVVPSAQHPADEGFTIIEVIVAAVVVVIGLLGLLTLLDGANQTTSTTLRREAATNLAREIVERSQAVPYASLAPATAAETLRSAIDPAPGARGSATAGAGSWTIAGRNAAPASRLTVSISTCSILAPSSKARVVDSSLTPCPSSGGGGGSGEGTTVNVGGCQATASTDPVIGVTIVLGVAVNACVGGKLAAAVCQLIGPVAPLGSLVGQDGAVNLLLGSLGGSFSADLCGGQPVVPIAGGSAPVDDARRVTVEVTWGTSSGQSVRETTIVPRPIT